MAHPIDEADIVAEISDVDPSEWLIATDADGTLWTGDVGEDVWSALTTSELLSEESAPASRALAEAAGLPTDGDATEVSSRLFDAYQDGHLDDRASFEAAALALSGHDVADITARIDDALRAVDLHARTHGAMRRIMKAARGRGLDVVIVSASARVVIERAVLVADIDVSGVIGVELATDGTHLSPTLAAELPYREGKAQLLRRRIGQKRVLFAFGDSPYDAELLRLAKTPVAVRPKAKLLAAGVDGLRELRLG